MLLRLTDGTTTLTLSGGGNLAGVTYVPQAVSVAEAQRGRSTVTEEVVLLVRASSAANAQASRTTLEKLLSAAVRRQQSGAGARIYAEYQAHDADAIHRTEILDGAVAESQNPALRDYRTGVVVLIITWERRPYWEGPLTQIVSAAALTNDRLSNTHYVAAAVAGTLPTPVKWQLTNATGSTVYVNRVHAAINAHQAPATFDGALAGATFDWTAPADIDVFQYRWLMTSAHLTALAGIRTRFLLALSSGATPGCYYNMALTYDSLRLLAKTDEPYADSGRYVLDCGSMRVPPGGAGTAEDSTYLEIRLGSATISGEDTLRWVQMVPEDNYQFLSVIGSMPNGEKLISDPHDDILMTETAGGLAQPEVQQSAGGVLKLYPGRTHRFIFVWSVLGDLGYTTDMTLDAWYRPRRVAL